MSNGTLLGLIIIQFVMIIFLWFKIKDNHKEHDTFIVSSNMRRQDEIARIDNNCTAIHQRIDYLDTQVNKSNNSNNIAIGWWIVRDTRDKCYKCVWNNGKHWIPDLSDNRVCEYMMIPIQFVTDQKEIPE